MNFPLGWSGRSASGGTSETGCISLTALACGASGGAGTRRSLEFEAILAEIGSKAQFRHLLHLTTASLAQRRAAASKCLAYGVIRRAERETTPTRTGPSRHDAKLYTLAKLRRNSCGRGRCIRRLTLRSAALAAGSGSWPPRARRSARIQCSRSPSCSIGLEITKCVRSSFRCVSPRCGPVSSGRDPAAGPGPDARRPSGVHSLRS